VIDVEPQGAIPRRIIQTWKSPTLPRCYRGFQARLRALHPGYEFLLFTNEDMEAFVLKEYPEFHDTFDRLPSMVSKSDLFRLLAVHRLGGFYLDLDVLPVRDFEPLRHHGCVFPFERQSDPYCCVTFGAMESLGQFAFGAVAGHPFPLACAENIRRAVTEPAWARIPGAETTRGFLDLFGTPEEMAVYYTTGPVMVTRTYAERTDLRSSVHLLYAFDPERERYLCWCFGVYGVHAMAGSWKRGSGGVAAGLLRRARQSLFNWDRRRLLRRCREV